MSSVIGWKKLVVLSISFLCVSCLKFYHHPQGGFRPKKPNFSINKEEFFFNVAIDTMAIYTKVDTLKYGKYNSVSYLKFYNNGRYFRNSFKPNIGINQENLYPASVGFYNTYKDSITLEYYRISALNKNDTEYVIVNGIIKGDSLIFKNRYIEDKKDIYVKQKLNFIPEPSNW